MKITAIILGSLIITGCATTQQTVTKWKWLGDESKNTIDHLRMAEAQCNHEWRTMPKQKSLQMPSTSSAYGTGYNNLARAMTSGPTEGYKDNCLKAKGWKIVYRVYK